MVKVRSVHTTGSGKRRQGAKMEALAINKHSSIESNDSDNSLEWV